MKETEFYLLDLEAKFKKIDKKKYYLAYSGGRDSHFLYWFIKEWLHDNEIEIVGGNTYLEHDEIIKRIYENADTVLLPKMKPFEIKEKYGSPCFSKVQDDIIYRYQHGSRSYSTLKSINNENSWFRLNDKAKQLLLSNKLHRISPFCCRELKKKPFHEYEMKRDKKSILGVRRSEGILRNAKYNSCFTKQGKFTPLHDLSDELMEQIYKEYKIPIPKIYNYLKRTGCAGCPYGSWKGETQIELDLLNDNKRKFVCKYFKESYEVLGIDTRFKQERLF